MKKWSTSTKVTVALVAVLLAWAIGRSIMLSRMAHVIAHQPMTRPAVEATRKLILKKRLARQFKDGTNHAKFMAIRTASTLLGDLQVVEIEGHHLTMAEAAAGAMVEFLSDLELPVRAAAGEALGRMGKPAARPLIDGALASPDKDVRTNATNALIRIGMVAVPEMIGAVRGGSPTQKVGCARALGQLKTTRAIPALVGALSVKETEVRLAARDALVAMGSAAVDPLIAALADKSPFTRRHSAEALGELEDLKAGDPLLALFADEHRLVRLAAIYAVGKVKAPQALNPLLAKMDDKDREVREAAAVSLGQIGAAAGVPRLIAALRDPIEAVREQAATALGRLAPSDLAQLGQIADLTRDPDLGTRYSAVLALGQIGNPASIPAVSDRLALAAGPSGLVPANEPSDKVRRRAATALGRLRSPQAVPLLLASFADPDWQVNYAARDALAEVGAPAVAPLLALAGVNDPDAKRAALVDLYIRQALGRMNPVPLPELTAALQSPVVRVRQVAALALGESRAPEAQALLEGVAANDADASVKYAAQRGLQLLRVAAAPTTAAEAPQQPAAPPAEGGEAAPAAQ